MKPLLPLALSLLALAPARDVCDECRRGKLCKPHAALEDAELERLRPQLASQDERERIEALRAVAGLTEEHENVPSEEVAEVLVAALEDGSLRVRNRAIRLLTEGQHPEQTVEALVDVIQSFTKNMWELVPWLTGPQGERGTVQDAMSYLQTTLRVAGDVPDDRVVGALAEVLLAFPTEMRGEPVAMAATHSLLELGTRDAVDVVMRQLGTWSEDRRMRKIHDALRGFAARHELEGWPDYGPDADKAWEKWYRRHSRSLPKKLGKWEGKPLEEEEDDD